MIWDRPDINGSANKIEHSGLIVNIQLVISEHIYKLNDIIWLIAISAHLHETSGLTESD